MLGARHRHLGMRRRVDARQQRADRGIADAVTLEMFERHAAIRQRTRQAVLYAEFGIEFALRVGPVGVASRRGCVQESTRSTIAGVSPCSRTSDRIASTAGC